MKILFVDQNFNATNIGGAFKSNYAIINELAKNPDLEIVVIASKSKLIQRKNLLAKEIKPILKTPLIKINNLIKYFRINQYFSFFAILREVIKFKPEVIIVQRDLTFPTILAGFLKKIPVINIIRDAMELCPKDIDTKGFRNCISSLTRKECWNCINKWRSLRVLLDDKSKFYISSLISIFHTIFYKFQYFLTKLYLFFIRYTYVNVVASPQMRDLVNKRIKSCRTLVRRITPIDSRITISTNKLSKRQIEIIENARNIILFVLPRNEGGSKGYPFVKRLLNKLPKEYFLIVIGTYIEELKEYNNVLNIDKIPTNNLYYLYQKADLTIVPSIYTEAFGRVVLESIINKTPVITSPQTSANYLFENKNYVKILPLKIDLWLKAIKEIVNNPIVIPDEDIRNIELKFSPKKCAKEILDLIKTI